MQITLPQEHHIPQLVQLSKEFAGEQAWASGIPIGQIRSEAAARERLFGSQALAVRVAVDEDGSLAGFAGVYRQEDTTYVSYLVGQSYRRQGVGSSLVETCLSVLPDGVRVEAWVLASNEASLAATPQYGFFLEQALVEDGQYVYVFVRRTGEQVLPGND